MPTALITGARGFTGQHLRLALGAAGYHVVGLNERAATNTDKTLEEYAVDLCHAEALKAHVHRIQPDVVVHLAGISFVAHDNIDALYRTHILGTRNLLQALATSAKKPHAVVLASSANIYGNNEQSPISETAPPQPANDYAVSKLAMEYMAALWREQLPITIVRPFNYSGAGQAGHFLLPKIVAHFQRREKQISLGNLDVARDFSDVRFVVDAYVQLIEQAPAGEVFNICSGRAVSLQEILTIMEQISGHTIEVTSNPEFVRQNEIRHLCGDNSKLIQTIGKLPAFSLQETLRWMYQTPPRKDANRH